MSRSVLVVDDDTNFCRLLEIYLGRSYTIKIANSVGEAEPLLELETFDCAVLDVTLPDRPGWELVEAISKGSPETPILLMTGLSDAATVERASALGVHTLLVKPQTPLEVKNTIDNLLVE